MPILKILPSIDIAMSDFLPFLLMAAMLLFAYSFFIQSRGKSSPPPARWKVAVTVLGAVMVPVAVFAARFFLGRP